MKVYRVSITFWLAFEWGGKSLKCPGLDGRDAKGALHVRKLRGLVSGVQGMGGNAEKLEQRGR